MLDLRNSAAVLDATAPETDARNLYEPLSQHAIVARTDRRGVIVDVNEKFCEISGYSREELLGQTHALVRSGYHDRSFWDAMWRTVATGQVWHGEICNRKKNGALYWVESTIAPQFSADGKIEGYLAIRTDVTRQKLSSLLIDAEHQALDAVATGLGLTTACTVILSKLADIDPDMCLSIFGLTDGRYLKGIAHHGLSESFLRTIDGADIGLDAGSFGAAVARNELIVVEDVASHPYWDDWRAVAEAENVAACWSLPIRNGAGDAIAAITIYYPNKRRPSDLERQLIDGAAATIAMAFKAEKDRQSIIDAKTRAQTLAEARRLFIANMNHELRTPLNHILGFAEMLLNTCEDSTDLEALECIKAAGQNILEKTNRAIEIANSHKPVAKQDFDLASFWRQSIEPMIAKMIDGQDRKLIVRMPTGDLPVHFAPENLRQALSEVLDNAFKFTDDGDRIDIRISTDRRLKLVHVTICDNGPGMTPDFAAKAHDAFEVEDMSLARKHDGMGLGLATANKLMLQSLGALEINSDPDKGACVRLSVPMAT